MGYSMRTSKPEAGNKYYIRQATGGWNGAIQGKPTDRNCNVLANCVGYANGRFAEIQGKQGIQYQLVCNAENFIEKAQSYGLEISNKPTLGGIMVWQKGGLSSSDGAGHVAIVERIDNENQIYTSESAYNAYYFANVTRNNANGRWGMNSNYTFRGCIKNPGVIEGITNAEIFDSDLYYWKYADLRKNVGTDYNKLFAHWIDFGIKEGRIGSYVFDAEFYYSKYKDLQKAFGKDWLALYNHYITFGIKEGRQASPVFDPKYYLAKNADLQTAFGNDYIKAIRHFIQFGIKEFRLTSKDFNINKYKEYKDLQTAFGNDCKAYYKHYMIFGIGEKRKAN